VIGEPKAHRGDADENRDRNSEGSPEVTPIWGDLGRRGMKGEGVPIAGIADIGNPKPLTTDLHR
jgi:hypothetical protein